MQAQRRLPARSSNEEEELDLEEDGGPHVDSATLLPLVQQAGSCAARHWRALALLLGLGLAATLFISHTSGHSAWQQQSFGGVLGQQAMAGGLQLKPGSPRGPSRASPQEVQALLANIARELEPWKERGIFLEGIERAYCSLGPYEKENFRLQVINGTGYVVGDVGGFQTRARSLRQQILDITQLYDVPDVDMMFSTSDMCKRPDAEYRSHDGNQTRCQPYMGPLVSQDKLDGEDHCLTAPDFSWGGWREAYTPDWERARAVLLDAQVPWSEKENALFWRGGPTTGERDVMVHHSASQHVHYDVNFIDWKDLQSPDRKGHEAESGFVGMSEHCRRRYLLHLTGLTYSARLKYLLLCNSTVLFPFDQHREFWYHLLEDGVNIVLTPRADTDNHGDPVVAKLDQLMADEAGAQQIAARGFHLASEILHPQNIHLYWLELFRQYAKLQNFKVQLHPDALPLIREQISPDKIIAAAQRTCMVC